MARVVVTGMGGVTALGSDWPAIRSRLRARANAVRYMTEWNAMTDLGTRLGAPIDDFEPPAHWSRKQLRSMGAFPSWRCAQVNLRSRTRGFPRIRRLGTGAWASPVAPPSAAPRTSGISWRCSRPGSRGGLNANSYVRMMPHTAAANVGIFFGLTGRIIPTSSACTSGSQGIGYACEAIRAGRQTLMLAGGAEELSRARRSPSIFSMRPAGAMISRHPRRGRTTAIATALSSARARRCSFSRTSTTPAPAEPASTRKSSALGATPTAHTSLAPWKPRWRESWSSRSRMPGSHPTHRLRQWPRHSDRAWRRRRNPRDVLAPWQPETNQLPKELPRTHARCLRRHRGLVHHRNDEGWVARADAQSR